MEQFNQFQGLLYPHSKQDCGIGRGADIDQLSRIESPEIALNKYGLQIFDKSIKTFSTMVVEQLICTRKKRTSTYTSYFMEKFTQNDNRLKCRI